MCYNETWKAVTVAQNRLHDGSNLPPRRMRAWWRSQRSKRNFPCIPRILCARRLADRSSQGVRLKWARAAKQTDGFLRQRNKYPQKMTRFFAEKYSFRGKFNVRSKNALLWLTTSGFCGIMWTVIYSCYVEQKARLWLC